MGWISEHRQQGLSHEDFFQEKLGEGQMILASHTARSLQRSVCYMAVRDLRRGHVSALVALFSWAPRARDNFCWKLIDEGMGPAETSCPERIIDLLTPVDECDMSPDGARNAARWREACLRSAKRRPRVSSGDTIRFDREIKTTAGPVRELVLADARRNRFEDEAGRVYHLTGWREDGYEVISRR